MSPKQAPSAERTTTTAIRRARRQELIDATITSIAKRGFAATTLSTVTQEAGLSHGVVNFHFDSKEALFVETLGHLAREHYAQWSGAVAKAGECPAAKLEALVRADFDPSVCSRKKLSVWFAFWGQAKHRPIYLETHDEHDRERGALIGELCATIIADGDYPQDDAATVGRNIEAVIDGLWLQMLLYPKLLSRPTALASALAFLATLFPKHFPRPSEPA